MPDDDTDRLTISQAAALLGVRRETVHDLIERGTLAAELAPVALGRRTPWLIRRADLVAYQARRAGKGKPGPRAGPARQPPEAGESP